MKRTLISLNIAAALLLTACGTHPPVAHETAARPAISYETPADKFIMFERSNAAAVKEYAGAPAYAALEKTARIAPAPSLPQNTEKYGKIEPNPVQAVARNPVSTFSIDVDTGSYANVRRFLNDNRLPPAHAVRIEELINYFDYGYAPPSDGKPFAVYTETIDSPWQADAKLIKIAIKAKEIRSSALPPANLVFLVDVSGSMQAQDKLPLVKKNTAHPDQAPARRRQSYPDYLCQQ